MLWIFDSLRVIVALETVSVLFTTFDDDLGVLLQIYIFFWMIVSYTFLCFLVILL